MVQTIFERIFSLLLIIIFIIPMIIIAILIKLTSKGPVLHFSKRIGKNSKIFLMPKFRTMKLNAPDVATHKLKNPQKYITRYGILLRKTSVDEIPQLFSILIGDMNFVGPRPALYNQFDLINLRKKYKIDLIKPGITGLAQIRGRDELSIQQKVDIEKEYLKKKNIFYNIKIIILTLINIVKIQNISH